MNSQPIARSSLRRSLESGRAKLLSSKKLQISAASIFLLMFFVDFGESTKAWQHFSDFLHTPIFFLSVIGIWYLLGETRNAQLLAGGGCLLAATLIEVIQPIFGRSESMTDIQNGYLGILLALIVISLSRTRSWVLSAILSPVLLFFFILPLGPAWKERALQKRRVARLPLIADFEIPEDLKTFAAIAEEEPKESLEKTSEAHSGQFALEIKTTPFQFSGAELRLESMDWSDYKALSFYVRAEEPFSLQLRIDDWGDCSGFDSRFNLAVDLSAGWNHVEVPLSAIENAPAKRKLNIRQLRRMLMFREASQTVWTFVLDDLKLIK